MLDLEKFVSELQDYVFKATQPLVDRIKRLEALVDDYERIERSIADQVSKIQIPEPVNGKDGRDGVSAEPVDYDRIERSLADMVSKIEIPEPVNGKDGRDGVSAEPVDYDRIERSLADMVSKIQIPEPVNGKDGRDGKDALQLEILPEIEEGKSYARGTYALRDGGLWRSFQQTSGIRGWECIVDGVATAEVKTSDDDPRRLVVALTTASGKQSEKTLRVPTVLDAGVYLPDRTYEKGDGVTWGGSFWIAQQDSPVGKPGDPASKGWRLAVKKGRDGKDGRDGRDLVKGVSLK